MRPKIAISAGTSVTVTASVTSTVTAIPGPKARKKSRLPITSEPEPTATISPAVDPTSRNQITPLPRLMTSESARKPNVPQKLRRTTLKLV